MISSVMGPTDRISWLLSFVEGQLLQYISVHLPNIRALLDQLHRTDIGSRMVIESFDVTSLYTNVSNSEAMAAVYDLLVEYSSKVNIYGFTIKQIMTLIRECLNCSISDVRVSTTSKLES